MRSKRPNNTTHTTQKLSWRDFYDIHPAAAFFHKFSSDEQLQELRDDIAKQQVILDPIHTANVPGALKPLVIDGVSRLDQLEALGREIIDENGDLKGMLAFVGGSNRYVIHHPGKTDQEVWSIVVSLNLKRRHHTAGQLAEIADRFATRPVGRPKKSANLPNFVPTQEQAAKIVGVSPRSLRQFRKVKKEAPEKVNAISKGKVSLSKTASDLPKTAPPKPSKPKKDKPFEDRIWEKWQAWLKKFSPAEVREIKQLVHKWTEA